MHLWFRRHTDALCSWSIVREELERACENLGHTVARERPKNVWKYVEVWWGAPQDWQWSNDKVALRIGITLSESDQLLKCGQERAIENLNVCDLIFVPTQSSMRAFNEMPIIDNFAGYWPLGVDPKKFAKAPRNFYEVPLSFLHHGVTQFRKGSWLVPEAFSMAFDGEASLTISSHTETEMYRNLRDEYGNRSNIHFRQAVEKYPQRHYDGHHVLVSPHLAEGWGLCITEAMALGIPCLVSRCSAPRDYFTEHFGQWVEMSDLYAPVNQCLVDTPGFWRVPDVYSLADGMRYMYDNREMCKGWGDAASAFAHEHLTWEAGAKKPLEIIEKYL